MHGTSARHEVRLGMWELRALTGASWVSGASHVAPALWFLPGKAAGFSASLARLLYLEQGNFRLRDLASGTGLAATGSRQVLRVVVGEL